MPPAIEVDDLWKQYRLGVLGYGTLRHDLQSWWARMRGREDPNAPLKFAPPTQAPAVGASDRFWALREISLTVEPGAVIGIIGPNGAGKSTLLKILSRVTSPTRGEVRLRGRVASLLEVGTGFHPDLTGRENVFLNGAILGMSRAEVRRKFDEIVAFAGLERFVETPVKRYSSGMYVRLAFAVAAHLEPEILLVDEVLAVGDLEFQRKCLGKLESVAEEGRSILFVSHNLGAISTLCSRALLISRGRLERFGSTAEVVRAYMDEKSTAAPGVSSAVRGDVEAWLVEATAEPESGRPDSIPVDAAIGVRLVVCSLERLEGVELSLRVERQDGQRVFTTSATDTGDGFVVESGTWEHQVRIPANFLAPGAYYATVAIHKPNIQMIGLYEQVVQFTVAETGSTMWRYHGVDYGAVLVRFPWGSRRLEPAGATSAPVSDASFRPHGENGSAAGRGR